MEVDWDMGLVGDRFERRDGSRGLRVGGVLCLKRLMRRNIFWGSGFLRFSVYRHWRGRKHFPLGSGF